jgi:hypothetical protein
VVLTGIKLNSAVIEEVGALDTLISHFSPGVWMSFPKNKSICKEYHWCAVQKAVSKEIMLAYSIDEFVRAGVIHK